jgi:hypothetical protein
MASTVFTIQTNKNGLCGPSQLTIEKLPMRITTASSSMNFIFFRTKAFINVVGILFGKSFGALLNRQS